MKNTTMVSLADASTFLKLSQSMTRLVLNCAERVMDGTDVLTVQQPVIGDYITVKCGNGMDTSGCSLQVGQVIDIKTNIGGGTSLIVTFKRYTGLVSLYRGCFWYCTSAMTHGNYNSWTESVIEKAPTFASILMDNCADDRLVGRLATAYAVGFVTL